MNCSFSLSCYPMSFSLLSVCSGTDVTMFTTTLWDRGKRSARQGGGDELLFTCIMQGCSSLQVHISNRAVMLQHITSIDFTIFVQHFHRHTLYCIHTTQHKQTSNLKQKYQKVRQQNIKHKSKCETEKSKPHQY